MAIDTQRIDQLGALLAPKEPAAAPASGDFRRLIDSLEQLVAEHKKVDDVQDADQLQDALRTADASFVTAMDLRRQLEEAFRQRLP